jgi:methyl-accepting chemotaxis protein
LTTASHDVAEQSNLLAESAAIEAAESAEEGDGFSVVADEIKSLAGRSKNAVQQVRGALADIVPATTATVDAAERSSGAIARSVERPQRCGRS